MGHSTRVELKSSLIIESLLDVILFLQSEFHRDDGHDRVGARDAGEERKSSGVCNSPERGSEVGRLVQTLKEISVEHNMPYATTRPAQVENIA